MEIRIEETNEIKEIGLIDPKSNCDWSKDFIGNAVNGAKFDKDGIMIMSQEDFDWWEEHTGRYEIADQAIFELLNGAESAEEEIKKDKLKELSHDYIGGFEFNDWPLSMVAFVEDNQ